MDKATKVELQTLLDYASRVATRVDMPSRSELGAWLQRLYTQAEDEAAQAFREHVDARGLPWSAVRPGRRGAIVTAPPALVLVLGGDGTEVPSELLDPLERWDVREIKRRL